MSLRDPIAALAELVEMTKGPPEHEWVIWKGKRWIFSSFDGHRTGIIATAHEMLLGVNGIDAHISGGLVLLDGRIALNGQVVGEHSEIIFTGERWT